MKFARVNYQICNINVLIMVPFIKVNVKEFRNLTYKTTENNWKQKKENIVWWDRKRIFGLMEVERENNAEDFELLFLTYEEEKLWGEWNIEHCIRIHGGIKWMCERVISVNSRDSLYFLYVKPGMESYYIILCDYYQLLPKLLDCEVKTQVKYMCSFKNHIRKNKSQCESWE